MKSIIGMTLGLVLVATALPALAGNSDNEQLAQCKSELAGIYGEDARFKLQSVTRGRKGKMRIKAMPADGDSVLVSCWSDAGGVIHLVDRDGVALANPGYSADGKLSLRD